MQRGFGTRWTTTLGVLFLGSLAVLALLQLRWIDAWSASEAERMQRFVASGVERVGFDLERAMEGVEEHFHPTDVHVEELPARLLALAAVSEHDLVRRVLWLDPRQPDAPLDVQWEAGRCVPLDASDEELAWGAVMQALLAGDAESVRLPATPAVLVPLLPRGGTGAQRPHFVVALLDVGPLAAKSVRRHLVEAFGGDLRVLVERGGRAVHDSGPADAPAVLDDPDAALTVGGARLSIGVDAWTRELLVERGSEARTIAVREVETEHADGRPAEPRGAPPAMEPLVVEQPPFTIGARHVAGSIEAAVSAVRRRNLALGLGLLGLLAVAASLLLLAARRARVLARQKVEFVAGVTHELRTPLTVIRSAAENLRDCVVTDSAGARRYGRLIHDEAKRLSDFVEHALSLAGARSRTAVRPVALGPLIERAVARCQATDGSGGRVAVELPDELPPALIDPDLLERALDNLLSNARKYGGPAPEIGVRAEVVASGVDVTVWDHGPGIAEEERGRVFEPFFRGPAARSSQTPGSGLGLAVVRHAVEAQGGTVTVDSARGAGCAFTLHLRSATA